ncbi:MAG: OmpH family outer membrane protein [Myxococcaceae bacterium]
MSSRQLLVPLLAGLSLLAPRVARAAELKIAYVDLQRAFAEVDEGKAAKARLEQMRDAKQKEIDKEQEVLKKEKETFEKQMATMTDAARTQKGSELQKKLYDLQQRFEKGRAELAQTERETLSGILGKMQPIIQSIAQRDGFTMVFEKTDSGLLYAPASLDLTNELIRLFNEKNKVAGAAASSTSSPKKSTAATTTPATPK